MSRRDIRVIVGIWVVVLTGAVVFAALIADDDPNTSEGAGAGALSAIGGSVLTGVYLLIRETNARRKKEEIAPSSSETERIVVPKGPRRPRPREWWVDAIGAGVLWIIGTVIAELVLGLDVSYDAWIGGLLPLAFLLVRHMRRSRIFF
jgi:hypothetical protein